MKRTAIINIGSLIQYQKVPHLKNVSENSLLNFKYKIQYLKNAFVVISGDTIENLGVMNDYDENADEIINAHECIVMPAYCDSHTHIVFAGSRESEFLDKINGLSYEEIAAKGGGILNSAKLLQNTNEENLVNSALQRILKVTRTGTAALEIKSGYGLNVESEIKMLRVIKKLKSLVPHTIKATFLGAHTIPAHFKSDRNSYINLIKNEMIPAIAKEKLADYCDVFCEKGFFSPEETSDIIAEGLKYGLKPKIHANQLSFSHGIQIGVQYNAISVDHLEYTDEEEIKVLLQSNTVPTVLPSASFYLNMQYPPAKKMIESGLLPALASDYNPGSSPSGNMNFVISLACIKMKMTPEQALLAATIYGARAMELEQTHGSIEVGKKANIIITKPMQNFNFLPYSFGDNLIDTVFVNGIKY